MKTEQIKQIAAEFAKKNKVAVSKVEQLAADLLAISKPAGGKKPNTRTIEVRQSLKDAVESGEISGEVTSKMVAEHLNIDLVAANNAIRYLADNHNIFKRVGTADKKPGERGRREVIWGVAS